uniref:Uncharacterized protein n=1 Tax=Lotus japonicus TaxID=34305 RepID=I3SCY6_LOTJA|nr:unknown [Lotus japonicus]
MVVERWLHARVLAWLSMSPSIVAPVSSARRRSARQHSTLSILSRGVLRLIATLMMTRAAPLPASRDLTTLSHSALEVILIMATLCYIRDYHKNNKNNLYY